MRLWSLHPRHLDQKALVACWREGLLAYHVLQGKTKWYKHHPQLLRFKAFDESIFALESYLHAICDEADARWYRFDRGKLPTSKSEILNEYGDLVSEQNSLRDSSFAKRFQKIPLTRGQLQYEYEHLKRKIEVRSPKELSRLEGEVLVHPSFILVEGGIEDWERI